MLSQKERFIFYSWLIFDHIYTTTYFMRSSVEGHLGYYHILTIVNNSTMNIGMHISFPVGVFVFFGLILKSRIAGSCSNSGFNFLRSIYIVFHSSIPFSPYHHQHLFFVIFFDNSHSGNCKVIAHCGFGLLFFGDESYWASFHVPVAHLCVFGKMCSFSAYF